LHCCGRMLNGQSCEESKFFDIAVMNFRHGATAVSTD
jgi:hypothetical protein